MVPLYATRFLEYLPVCVRVAWLMPSPPKPARSFREEMLKTTDKAHSGPRVLLRSSRAGFISAALRCSWCREFKQSSAAWKRIAARSPTFRRRFRLGLAVRQFPVDDRFRCGAWPARRGVVEEPRASAGGSWWSCRLLACKHRRSPLARMESRPRCLASDEAARIRRLRRWSSPANGPPVEASGHAGQRDRIAPSDRRC
jgi:hypothetical protein